MFLKFFLLHAEFFVKISDRYSGARSFIVHISDLNEHRFYHNFACENPNCKYNLGIESTIHYVLHCHLYRAHRSILRDEFSDIVGNDISQLPDDHLCDLLLFGSKAYNEKPSEMVLKCIGGQERRQKIILFIFSFPYFSTNPCYN